MKPRSSECCDAIGKERKGDGRSARARPCRRRNGRDVFRPARRTTNPEAILVCEALLLYGALWKTS